MPIDPTRALCSQRFQRISPVPRIPAGGFVRAPVSACFSPSPGHARAKGGRDTARMETAPTARGWTGPTRHGIPPRSPRPPAGEAPHLEGASHAGTRRRGWWAKTDGGRRAPTSPTRQRAKPSGPREFFRLENASECWRFLCPASDAVRLKRIALSRPSVLAYAISIMGSRGVHSAWSPPRRGVGRDQRHGVSDMRSTGPSVFRSP